MIKRKLQVILFGALLTFSAAAQSQTATINNPLLTQLARQFVASFAAPGTGLAISPLARAANARTQNGPKAISGGSLVIDGVVQEITSLGQLTSSLVKLARQPGFDPSTITILTAASPNS